MEIVETEGLDQTFVGAPEGFYCGVFNIVDEESRGGSARTHACAVFRRLRFKI